MNDMLNFKEIANIKEGGKTLKAKENIAELTHIIGPDSCEF